MYWLSKIHKSLVNSFPKLRPILSAIKSGMYKLAKPFVPLLKLYICKDYTEKDSFDFTLNISQQNSKLFMASLNVHSLFTKVPLDETVNICVNKLFKVSQTYIVLFDKHYYRQIDRVVMGFLLGPVRQRSSFQNFAV